MYTPVEHVTVNLKASNGKHIRKVSRVIFSDEVQITFIERLSKREAFKQAVAAREGDSTRSKWQYTSIDEASI